MSSTALSSFRNLEEYQRSVRQAGHRVYHHLTESQKAELKQLLKAGMNAPALSTSGDDSWKVSLEQTTKEIIRTKNERGEIIDANALVEEVLPIAHASIPIEVRQKLFSRIFEMTSAGSANLLPGVEGGRSPNSKS